MKRGVRMAKEKKVAKKSKSSKKESKKPHVCEFC